MENQDLFASNDDAMNNSATDIISTRLKELEKKRKAKEEEWDIGFYYAPMGDILPIHSIGAMEYPFFSLKKLELEPFVCEYKTGASLAITGNAEMHVRKKTEDGTYVKELISLGRATAYDEKLWVYLISKMQANYDATGSLYRRIRFNARDYLKNIGLPAGGSQFATLEKSLYRLRATQIVCNLESKLSGNGGTVIANKEYSKSFNLIDSFEYLKTTYEKKQHLNKMEIEVELPHWIIQTIQNKALLKISSAYITEDLTNLEKRVYLICEKFCGNSSYWHIGLENLQARLGSTVTLRHFKHELKKIIVNQSIPKYKIGISDDGRNFQVAHKE
ncbi:TPA: replication initiator protein A [Neisseria meningitidis]